MNLLKATVCLLLASSAVFTSAQTQPLTDDEVQVAIQRGMGKRRDLGLSLRDQLGGCTQTCPTEGFTVHIYTSAQWIEDQAQRAKRRYLPFTISDVTPEMRANVLHVVAWPDTPNFLTASAMSSASSAKRVTLMDLSKTVIIQPESNVTEELTSESALRSATYTKAIATFSMEDLAKVRGDKGEFFVVVVGDGKNKEFKVKERMLSKLFGK